MCSNPTASGAEARITSSEERFAAVLAISPGLATAQTFMT